jgi:cysteine desulfurase
MAARRTQWLAALAEIPGTVVNGDTSDQLPNTVNFSVEGIPGEDILLNFDLAGIAASSGSACSSGVSRPSHVLTAMGRSEWAALNSVRVSFAAETTEAEVAVMQRTLQDIVRRGRARSR